MINKEELTRHIHNLDDKIFVHRVLDRAEGVLKNYTIRNSEFCDPYQISICKPILNKFKEIQYFVTGGYDHAERQIIVMFPDFLENNDVENPLMVVKLEGSSGDELNHRDVLGSILGLGIKREKIGDIIIHRNCAYVISFREICEFIQMNLERVSRYIVKASIVNFCDMEIAEEKYELVESTVSSLRLDAVISVGFGESRSSLTKVISNDKIKVNWKTINNAAYPLHEGDVISFKGKGRIILLEVGNKTKKDRYKITIKRMI